MKAWQVNVERTQAVEVEIRKLLPGGGAKLQNGKQSLVYGLWFATEAEARFAMVRHHTILRGRALQQAAEHDQVLKFLRQEQPK